MNPGPAVSGDLVDDWGAQWLSPVSPTAPCGPSLEYDPDHAVLRSRMLPRAEAQYGDFIGLAEAPNWGEVERDCVRLLARTRDIHLLVWLCRARTRLAGATGLAQGLAVLAAVLARWPDAVHPQRVIEGEDDPTVRTNALAALADPDGLVGDVREIVVHAGSAARLTVRDVDRALHAAGGASLRDSVGRQLSELRRVSGSDPGAPLNRLASAACSVQRIVRWSRAQLAGEAPEPHPLQRLLSPFHLSNDVAAHEAPGRRTSSVTVAPLADAAAHQRPTSRDDALNAIRAVRAWFEVHEPSTPVVLLLRQAESLVGRPFAEVVGAIPQELLQKWGAAK